MHVSDLHVLFCLHNMSLSCKFLFPTIIVLNKVVQNGNENVAISLYLIIIASAALRIRRDWRRSRRWAHAWKCRRRQFGAHHALMKELASEEPRNFRNFIPMDKQDFWWTSYEATPFIQKQDTNMCESINPAERLSPPLCYLAFLCICWHFSFSFFSFLSNN